MSFYFVSIALGSLHFGGRDQSVFYTFCFTHVGVYNKNIFRHINGKRIVFSLKIIGRFFHIFRCVIFVPKLIMAILFGWKSHI